MPLPSPPQPYRVLKLSLPPPPAAPCVVPEPVLAYGHSDQADALQRLGAQQALLFAAGVDEQAVQQRHHRVVVLDKQGLGGAGWGGKDVGHHRVLVLGKQGLRRAGGGGQEGRERACMLAVVGVGSTP